jgi:hypothetical protein
MQRLNKTFNGRDHSSRKSLKKRNKLSSSFRQDFVYPAYMTLEKMLNEFQIFQKKFMSYVEKLNFFKYLKLQKTKKMRQLKKKESKSRVKDVFLKRSLLSCKKRRINSDWPKLNKALITTTPKFSLTQLSYFFNKNEQEQFDRPALDQLVTSKTDRLAQNKMDIELAPFETSKTNVAQLDREADDNLESTRIETEQVEGAAFCIERMVAVGIEAEQAVEAAIVVVESLETARLAQMPVVDENEEQSDEEDFLEKKNETSETRMDVNVNKNETKKSGRKSLLTTENKSIVENFFEVNNNPTAIDLEELFVKTGLKKSYLTNWFSNKRHDLKKNQKNTNQKTRPAKKTPDKLEVEKVADAALIEKQAAEK